jgi:ABC-type polysaccharide/polyol phosphate transport system ATPase subunit
MNDSSTVIALNGISKSYPLYDSPIDRVKEVFHPLRKQFHKTFEALKPLSLTVHKGESIGVIGKNGSGKSTLLQIICGTMTPSSGNVSVQGKISALLELGSGFNPEFSGRDNVYLLAGILGLTKKQIDAQIADILAFADIGDFIDQPVRTYSSGMVVRLAFAVSIHVEPEILIIDEALAVGDVFFQAKCFAFMKDRFQDVTKILVSHDLGSIAKLCTRVIYLDRGELLFDGDPLTAIEQYTKQVHTERFQMQTGQAITSTETHHNFLPIAEDKRGGALELAIDGYSIAHNKKESLSVVQPGDTLDITMKISASRPFSEVICGYLVNDKFGNALFGNNTTSSSLPSLQIPKAGTYCITISLTWPEVQKGDYFLTLGLGEGNDAMHHTIQCWAHNIAVIECSPLHIEVHGLFNNYISHVHLEAL